MKDNRKKKILAGSLAAVLGGMTLAGACYHQGSVPASVQAEEEVQALEEAAGEVISAGEDAGDAAQSAQSAAPAKEESVYVKADPSGKVTQTTVTEWLKNPGKGTIEDTSELTDITNVKGEETFSRSGDGTLTWQSEGKDIYYQGETSGELPVDVTVSYKLDGKSVSAKELTGKSGQVEIGISYHNRSKQKVDISGETVEMYTPFTMVTAMMLPTDEYTNVTVDNGKVISDGDKNIVIGVGMPGMKENLRFDEADIGIDIPESVTITADVKDASVGPTVTMASADALNEFDLDEIDGFDDLESSVDELENAAAQLVDGSDAAADGAGELADGAKTLKDGTAELKQGSGELAAGTKAVSDGAGELSSKGNELVKGVNDLVKGIGTYLGGVEQLEEKRAELKTGATQLSDGMDALNQAVTEPNLGTSISDLKTGAETVQQGLSDVSDALGSIIQDLENQRSSASGVNMDGVQVEIGELSGADRNRISNRAADNISVSVNVPDTVPEEYQAEVKSAMEQAALEAARNAANSAADEIISETYEAAQNNVTISGQATTKSSAELDTIATLKGIKANLDKLKGVITTVVKGLSGVDTAMNAKDSGLLASIGQLTTGAKGVKEGVDAFVAGVDQLSGNNGSLAGGADKLKTDVSQLPARVKQLADGAKAVTDGAKTLDAGVGKLDAGAGTLLQGTNALNEGNQQLADGMSKFKKEGIDEIADIFNGDFRKIKNRLDAMTEIGSSYRSYAGIREGMEGSTKFIIETEGISLDE